MTRHWSESDFELAVDMLKRGEKNHVFVAKFGRSKKAAENRLYRQVHGSRPSIAKRPRSAFMPVLCDKVVVPEDIKADAQRRAAIEYLSLTAAFCRDPLPGRSALDLKKVTGASA